MFRGILSTIYLKSTKKNNAKSIANYLKRFYKKNRFIKICKNNTHLSTNDVINTNNCYISVNKTNDANRIIILSVIDNLIKGGAGQAVQNMNNFFGFESSKSLK
tara:strand:- start:222 stop:533 length:312 start_codon:yes stop_codon:yes gene_type:complete